MLFVDIKYKKNLYFMSIAAKFVDSPTQSDKEIKKAQKFHFIKCNAWCFI